MNFNIDNLKEDKTPKKKENDKNKTIVIICVFTVFIILILGFVNLLFSKDKNVNSQTNIEVSTPQEPTDEIPTNRSISLTNNEMQIESMNAQQLGYEALVLDTIFKVEKIVLYKGYLDNSAPKPSENLSDYVSRCYGKENKTDCESFYCALWEGKDSLSKFCFELLKKYNLGSAVNYNNYNDFYLDYYNTYFEDYEFNNLDINEELKIECQEFLKSIKIDNNTGFYNFINNYSFKNHTENYSIYLPSEAIDFSVNERSNKHSFYIEKEGEPDKNGDPTIIRTKYFFHQLPDGTIYYDTNDKVVAESIEINYLNRFDNYDFFYFEESVSMNRIGKNDIATLINLGYEWINENSIEKTVGDKTHRIIFKN